MEENTCENAGHNFAHKLIGIFCCPMFNMFNKKGEYHHEN